MAPCILLRAPCTHQTLLQSPQLSSSSSSCPCGAAFCLLLGGRPRRFGLDAGVVAGTPPSFDSADALVLLDLCGALALALPPAAPAVAAAAAAAAAVLFFPAPGADR